MAILGAWPARWSLLLVTTLTMGYAGCASGPSPYPTPDELATRGNLSPEATEEALGKGRALLMTACGRCHRPRLPRQYPMGTWERVLRGGHRASLTPDQVEALLSYVREIHREPESKGARPR